MYIYLNGQIIKEEEAKISVFDHGFMYGLGLFETFRVYQGHPFLFHDHMNRLRQSLKELNIRLELSDEQLLHSILDLLHKNKIKDAYVRLNVSAGPSSLGLVVDEYENPTTIIYMKTLPTMSREKEGVILQTPRNTPEGSYRLKSHHYLNNIIAKREVGQAPTIEGIFLTKEGYVAEGIVSNIFWVKNGIVYTPSIETGILNGITRQFVIKVLEQNNISVIEGLFQLSDLVKSAEVFVTNSVQEIVPMTKIHEHYFTGENGNITSFLQKQYNKVKHSLFTFNEYVERFDDN